MKCFPNRALGKIKKKDLCYLVFSDEVISLIKPRFLRSPVITELYNVQMPEEIKEGLMSYSIEVTDDAGYKKYELILGRAYVQRLDALKSKLRSLKGR